MASILDQYLQASAGENLNPFLGPDVTEPVSLTRIFLPYFKAWNTTFPIFLFLPFTACYPDASQLSHNFHFAIRILDSIVGVLLIL